MKIRRLESFLLSYPFPEPLRLPYFGGVRTIVKRDAMLIRVTLDNDLTGYAPGIATEKAHAAIGGVIAPFLEGRTLADPDALRVLFAQGPGTDAAVARVFAAVEIALYDVLGKALGVPVSELLGGRERERIRLYASAGMHGTSEDYAREALALAGQGFRAYKMRLALGPEGDIQTLRRVREAVGPGVELMVDAHSWWRMGDRNYSFETVEQVAREIEQYDVTWLEEPLRPEDHEAYRRLRELDIVPLAGGEHEPDIAGFESLLDGHCVDHIQMDIACQGGYGVARHLLYEAARVGVCFAFHSWGTALDVVAAAQIGICWPDNVAQYLEYPCYRNGSQVGMYEFPLASEISKTPLKMEDGDLILSREPGLGVVVEDAVIDRYRWVPGPWSYFDVETPAKRLILSGDHSASWNQDPANG